MELDIHVKSEQLLQKIANSMHDRGVVEAFFTIAEMHVVEVFLRELMGEADNYPPKDVNTGA